MKTVRLHSLRALALAAVIAAGAGQALAQAPTPGALAAAREYIQVKGATTAFDAVVPGVIETAKNLYLRNNPQLAKDLNEVAAALRTEYAGRKEELYNFLVSSFASRFNEKELREAVAFYKSPTGQKLVQQEAVALDEGMARAQSWANQFSDEMVTRFRVDMRKRGHNL